MAGDRKPKQRKPRTKPNSDTWKDVERDIAAMLGGERIPVTGRSEHFDIVDGEEKLLATAPDIDHDALAIEVKHGKQIPALLRDAMAQAVAAQRFYLKKLKGDRIPIVVFHPDRARRDESFVIVRIKDLRALQGVALPEGDPSIE